MKRVSSVLILLILLALSAEGQFWYNKIYADRPMSELNTSELSLLFEKTSRTLNTGVILTGVGAGVSFIGAVSFIFLVSRDLGNWDYSGDTAYSLASIATITGVCVAAIGIPAIIIGSQRRKTVESYMKKPLPETRLQLTPSVLYNSNLKSYCTGLTITISL